MNSWFVSLLFFVYTLGLAYWQHWSATDIVWSMWFASLVSGYVIILCNIFGHAADASGGVSNRAGGIGKSLFLLVFFSVHFIGFHFGHSQVMWSFFPLSEQQPAFLGLIEQCAERYWAFILVALLNVWPLVRSNWQTESELRFEEPYKAVIRNHVMIFIVAFASKVVSQQQLLYLLLVFYFFPFAQLRSLFARGEPSTD
ncbi:MAG: DUF6498-containing protein [Pseudomonadales bacterium]